MLPFNQCNKNGHILIRVMHMTPYPKDLPPHTEVEALLLRGRTSFTRTRENHQQRMEEEHSKILKYGCNSLHSFEIKIHKAAFSPNGNLVTVAFNREVGLWDSVTGAFHNVCEIPRSVCEWAGRATNLQRRQAYGMHRWS